MSDKEKDTKRDPSLNPALKNRTEKTHDTRESTRPPAETASVQKEEGRAWPAIWAVVTILGVLLALYILFW